MIVGLGATTCQQFNDDVKSNPLVRRDYLAWAQGFMSGILLGRPPGVDTGLDLNPGTFDLINQLHLEDHCARNTSVDFADAVEALYKRLRKPRQDITAMKTPAFAASLHGERREWISFN